MCERLCPVVVTIMTHTMPTPRMVRVVDRFVQPYSEGAEEDQGKGYEEDGYLMSSQACRLRFWISCRLQCEYA